MRFTKMHGIGNDYVYVNCFEETVETPSELAKFVSRPHFGVGSDGLILIKPSAVADCEMEMYNADGSQGAMCGNGIRCVGKYVYDYGIAKKERLTVATKSGVKTLELTIENDKAVQIRVDMGAPILTPSEIPLACGGERAVGLPLVIDGRTWQITGVSMGNPHAVTYLHADESLRDFPLEKIGPKFEHHALFPDRVNTEFVKVIDRQTLEMRVWERGSGETLACGTGACAVAVASILNGYADDEVTVRLLGGDLKIFWDRAANTVYMTGPAEVVFDGKLFL